MNEPSPQLLEAPLSNDYIGAHRAEPGSMLSNARLSFYSGHHRVETESMWTASTLGRSAAAAIMTIETPGINDALRVVAAGALIKFTDPVSAMAIYGAGSMAFESAGGVVTADLMATETGAKWTDKINSGIKKLHADKLLKTNVVTEFAVSMLAGTPTVTAVKHRQDPERTRSQNRRYAVKNAAIISAVGAGQVLGIAEGVSTPSPTTIGLGALAVGSLGGIYKWSSNRLRRSVDEAEVEAGGPTHAYVNAGESPQGLGLSIEDSHAALEDSRTIFIENEGEKSPILVPVDTLHWYNHEYLKERFETDEIYYYAHPDIEDEAVRQGMYERISEEVAGGKVVLYDTVTAGDVIYGDLDHELQAHGVELQKASITKDERQRFLYQYDGKFLLDGNEDAEFKVAPGVHETYLRAVDKGAIEFDPQKGAALEAVIDGEEAERLWNIYQAPFEKLSKAHPINSGYGRDEFMEILKDPEMVKAVYRKDGVISTLALFLNNIEHCDWLDARYYENNYPEAVATGNHFVFPAIVTDESMRGSTYSLPLLKLIAQVQALRETPAIISFECTDISYKYVPRLVKFGIGRSGVASAQGFDEPVSRFDYYAITK